MDDVEERQGLGPATSARREGARPSGTTPPTAGLKVPSINLPKGGGAIRGIGEKFAANPVTGTGSLSVPIATSPGRSGFGPQLSLSYDSGAGNGPFGFGWSFSLPSITRKTDKGLPKYHDAKDSDEFILSGAEDLVPILIEDPPGQWLPEVVPPRTVDGKTYDIHRYRPRIEGLFARIERWTNQTDPKDSFWRSISKDNITTWYGKTDESRISDPDTDKPARIFSWLICESYDDKGNAIVYEYEKENDTGVDESHVHEKNRRKDTRSANRYLKRIKYGNKTSRLVQPDLSHMQWLFEVVFDYLREENGAELHGQHYKQLAPDADSQLYVEEVSTNEQKTWGIRQAPFSSYRAGFEVRTYRLCYRVLMFHHFPNELDAIDDYLVRSTEFTYDQNPIASFITSVTQSGYVYNKNKSKFLKKSLPPLEFKYSEAVIQDNLEQIDPESLENLPVGLDGAQYQWADLDGEGAGGILTEQSGGWYYKRNLSPLPIKDQQGQLKTSVRFAPVETLTPLPSFRSLSGGQQQILDLAGDGQVDVVTYEDPIPGFFERTDDGNWKPFKSFKSIPNIAWQDPNLKFVDLTGDGHADILITEDEAFSWYPSLAELGFADGEKVRQVLDEEKGPRLVFADGTQSIYLSDLSGDGLTDLVRIRNGEVCYWPNLGYGRFGAKVTMDNGPRFDTPDQFDQKRIRLADIDGSGATDILYLNHDSVDVYLNQSGNSWTDATPLTHLSAIDNTTSVMVADLMGNGTACLVWSSPLPGNAESPMRYVDLMGGQKPHLLISVVNNLGAETHVYYAPSTKFYLKDKQEGKEWITRLHFPVHVVERVETVDHISRNRFVTRYAYHHGFFDGHEREFRGFGMVEQFDTEEFEALSGNGNAPQPTNVDQASHVPPVHTKTWFHTGAYLKRNRISNYFEREYFREPGLNDDEAKLLLLEDTIFTDNLTIDEEREACRSLKGQMLRQEVYALDGTDKAQFPYTVTEQNFTIKRLQAKADNPHAVFFTHARESLSYHYERIPEDPRISHALTLEVDKYGNVIKSIAMAYGRRKTIRVVGADGSISEVPNPKLNELDSKDQDKQTQTLITYTENEVTYAVDKPATHATYDPDNYRSPLLAETHTYEVTGYDLTGGIVRFSFEKFAENNFHALTAALTKIEYEQPTDYTKLQKRLIERVRTLYRKNNLTALLGPGVLESMALPGESYKLAFTPGLLDQVYQRNGQPLIDDYASVLKVDQANAKYADRGGYVEFNNDGHWWIPSGRVFYKYDANDINNNVPPGDELNEAQAHFFTPRRFVDPFNNSAVIDQDAYDLSPVKTVDAVGNIVESVNDYRVLQTKIITDPNGNQSFADFDALGLVVTIAVAGKQNENLGDTLDDFYNDNTLTQANPTLATLQAFVLDPRAKAEGLLMRATTRIVYDLECYRRIGQPPFAATLARETHVSDGPPPGGLGIQVSFSYSDGFGREIQKKIQAETGPLVEGGLMVDPRWVGSGWMIFNNKGKPVRQYEPFFDDTHDFKFGIEVGVSPVLFYDPVERVVATLHPNHTYEKVVFDPWQQTTYDVNDTVMFDPSADNDVKGFLLNSDGTPRTPSGEYLPTWHVLRTDPLHAVEFAARYPHATDRSNETGAAAKAATHADTPTTAYFDTLGRPFLTVAHNKVVCPNHDLDGTEDKFHSRVELDIEGNQRAVRDERKLPVNSLPLGPLEQRIVMRYDYDMLGNRVHQASMEAGERWMLNDVAGKPIRAWDSRGHNFVTAYDVLRRPVEQSVRGTTADSDPRTLNRDILVDEIEYGEGQANAEALNLRTRIYRHSDSAGVVTNAQLDANANPTAAYDFKGNLLHAARQLTGDYKALPDWSTAVAMEQKRYSSHTTYDALNRLLTATSPDGSIYRSTFNGANLLEKVDVNLRGAAAATPFVINIDYDAKGQRKLIEYGSGATGNPHGVTTAYDYDPLTFRLVQLTTKRPLNLNGVATQLFKNAVTIQDLSYTYDPAGNITHIADNALLSIHHSGQQIDPLCNYTYDALYRLIEATGREHIGQSAFMPSPPNGHFRDYPFVGANQLNNPQELRNYTEQYVYDAVGNFESMAHQAASGNWTRTYDYVETSQIEPGKKSNRLSKAPLQSDPPSAAKDFGYDPHGNMTRMPHLPLMSWDYRNQLMATAQQVVNNGTPETTWYVYDASSQRVRKVTESIVSAQDIAAGKQPVRLKERIYLGGFEIYRKYEIDGVTPELERETLHIMDDKQRIALAETKTIENSNPVTAPVPLQRYQLSNHLGSASLELAEDGALVTYEEYHPYGTTAFQAGRSAAEVSLKRYRYTGKERDEESGFYFHGARYYATWLGRWTATDPAVLVDGSNMYQYAGNAPQNYVDRTGKQGYPVLIELQGGGYETAQRGADTERGGLATIGTGNRVFDFSDNPSVIKGSAQSSGDGTPSESVIPPELREALDRVNSIANPQSPDGVEVGQNPKDHGAGKENLGEGQVAAALTSTVGADLSLAGIVRSQSYKPALAAIGKNVGDDIAKAGAGLVEKTAKQIAEKASAARDAARTTMQNRLGPVGKGASRLLEKPSKSVAVRAAEKLAKGAAKTRTEAYLKVAKGAGEGTRGLANTLGTAAKIAGPALAVVGGVMSAKSLASSIERGDTAAAVGDVAGVASSSLTLAGGGLAAVSATGTGAAAVGTAATAGGLVTGAFAAGYGVGTVLNEAFVEDQIDKLELGSGAVGEWYWRTFLK